MRKLITHVTFLRVTNLEYAHLMLKLTKVAAKHDPAALKIEGVYNLLVAELPKLKILQVKQAKHPKTIELKAMREKRHSLLVVITGKIRLMPKAKVEALSESAALVLPLLEKYLKNILTDKLNTQSEKVNELFNALGNDAAMNDALSLLGLKVYLDELKALQADIEGVSDDRVENRSVERQTVEGKKVKIEVSEAANDLLNAVEIAKKENKELDYMPLINEINELLRPYKADIKARDTRAKNALLVVSESQKTENVAV